MCIVHTLWQRAVTACSCFCVVSNGSPELRTGFTDPSFSGVAVRQGLVAGGFGLALNDGNIHFMIHSNLTSSFDEIMVKPL